MSSHNPPPHDILSFCSDQHSAGIPGAMGDPIVRTPNLDQIAASGMLFGNGDTPVREYDRQVVSTALEYLSRNHDRPQMMAVGRMIHRHGKKLICYSGPREHALLFDTRADPNEKHDLSARQPRLFRYLRQTLERSHAGADRSAEYLDCLERCRVLAPLGAEHPEWNPYTYLASERVRRIQPDWKQPASQAERGGFPNG